MSPPNPPLATAARQPELPSPEQFLDLIADKLVATELVFRSTLENDVPFVRQAGEYLFDGGGKRMRPALLLLSARLLDRDSDEEVTYAAVIELIHTATLIHDDIIDQSSLRRGRQTVNHLWGNSLTVLLGDWLYTTRPAEGPDARQPGGDPPPVRRHPAHDRGRAAGPTAARRASTCRSTSTSTSSTARRPSCSRPPRRSPAS